MEKIRAFIAIEVNEESTLSEILEYQSRLQKSIGPLKLVDKHLMHITIRFLGDITTDHAKLIYEFIENEINKIYFSDLDKKIVAKIKGAGDFKIGRASCRERV